MICRRLICASVSIGNQNDLLSAEMVSGNYFTMLGVKPTLGRVFNSKEDDQVYGDHPVVVLGSTCWRTRFAGNRNVLAKRSW